MYRYEVFLSYARGEVHSRWLSEHFLPLFKHWLAEEIAECCKRRADELFHDEKEILPGMDIPDRVANGLKAARCLLALVSPKYLLSNYCLAEWNSFRKRSQKENRDLVVPAILGQGQTVRKAVGDTMWADFSDYTIVGEGFKKTERYVQFQDEIKKLAKRVASIIADAPSWSDFEICDIPKSTESRSADPGLLPYPIAPPPPIPLIEL